MPRYLLLLFFCVMAIASLFGLMFWTDHSYSKFRRPQENPERAETGLLRNVTVQSGIDHRYQNDEEANHFTMLEAIGGGVGLIDFDNDGLYDVFLTGGGFFGGAQDGLIKGYPCRMYKNLGDFKFEDVTAAMGLDKIDFYTHGVAVADFDCDGWPDLLVTGYGRLALFHNVPVDPADPKKGRRFVDVTEQAGLTPTTWTTSAAWADFDGDGYPDLYVCQYVDWSFIKHPACRGWNGPRDICPPKTFFGLPHLLFRNNGDGTFTNVAQKAGIRVDPRLDRDGKPTVDIGKGLAVAAGRFNESRRPSIMVANDCVENFLYLNQGGWKFLECASNRGVARDERGNANGNSSIAIADYDRSGLASIFCSTYENESLALFRNLGKNGQFLYSSSAAGLTTLPRDRVGYGCVFVDLDQDGWEDLLVVNGHAIRNPPGMNRSQFPLLLRNADYVKAKDPTKGRVLKDISRDGGSYFEFPHRSRGLAMGDLDNDGRPDFVISHLNERVAILQGNVGAEGARPHWVGLDLKGKKHRDIVGTRVIIEVNGQKLTRFVYSGGSYLSSHDPRILVGLGKASKVDRVTIEWSHSDQDQVIEGRAVAIDAYCRIVEK